MHASISGYLEILPETWSILGKQVKLTQCTLNKQQEVRDCWYVQLYTYIVLYTTWNNLNVHVRGYT